MRTSSGSIKPSIANVQREAEALAKASVIRKEGPARFQLVHRAGDAKRAVAGRAILTHRVAMKCCRTSAPTGLVQQEVGPLKALLIRREHHPGERTELHGADLIPA